MRKEHEMRNTNSEAPTPKLLPWLARRAGLDEARAGELWRQALAESGEGEAAMAAFRRLLDREAPMDARNALAPWLDIQDRLWRATPLLLADSLVRAANHSVHCWHRAARLAA